MSCCGWKQGSFAPAWGSFSRRNTNVPAGPYARSGPSLVGACGCGGSCGTCAVKKAHDHDDGESCHCGGSCGPCAAREAERKAGSLPDNPTDAELVRLGISREEWNLMSVTERQALVRRVMGGAGDCPFGASRLPDGTCPGGGGGGGGGGSGLGEAIQLPAGWDSWTTEQQRAWAADYARRLGLSESEQRAFAERAAAADRAMVTGIINSGVSLVRDWINTRSAERVAEIEAQARIRVAEIQARGRSQENLNPRPPAPSPPATSSVADAALPLGLLFLLLRGGL